MSFTRCCLNPQLSSNRSANTLMKKRTRINSVHRISNDASPSQRRNLSAARAKQTHLQLLLLRRGTLSSHNNMSNLSSVTCATTMNSNVNGKIVQSLVADATRRHDALALAPATILFNRENRIRLSDNASSKQSQHIISIKYTILKVIRCCFQGVPAD